MTPGSPVPIRVRPDATDQPTLLGEWTKPSTVPLIRMLSVELLLLFGLVVCGRYAVRRD